MAWTGAPRWDSEGGQLESAAHSGSVAGGGALPGSAVGQCLVGNEISVRISFRRDGAFRMWLGRLLARVSLPRQPAKAPVCNISCRFFLLRLVRGCGWRRSNSGGRGCL